MPITPYNSIDSSVDATEGWSRFGADREGVMPMLQVGVNGLGALASEPQAFRLFSNLDQRQIMDEIEENPGFGKKITAALHRHGGNSAIVSSAKRAILNELNPKEYPETRGEWVTLRRRMRVLLRDIPAAISQQVDSMSLSQKTAALMALARGGAPNLQLGAEATTTPAASGGSMWGDLIGGVVKAAAGIYAVKLDSSTQRSIANINAQGAAAQAAGAAQIAQAQAALAAAQATVASGGRGGGGGGGMSPLVWALPAGLGVLGLILYLVMKR